MFSLDGYEGIFHPNFVHQFFSEHELVNHFQDIARIEITIDCITLLMYFEGRNMHEEPIPMVQLSSILQPLLHKLPEGGFFFDIDRFEGAVEGEQLDLCELLDHVETIDNTSFQLGKGTLENPFLGRFNMRMQPLLLFFIDGASIINGSDPKWQLHFLLSVKKLVGFCSAYPFLSFPEGTRLRISQFFIMPPHQRRGIGSLFYRNIVKQASAQETIKEITVEDPSDSFSDFRLSNDRFLLDCKIIPLQRVEANLLLRYQHSISDLEDETSMEFIAFRKEVKKHLVRRYANYMPSNRDERIGILESFFQQEMARFRKILKA